MTTLGIIIGTVALTAVFTNPKMYELFAKGDPKEKKLNLLAYEIFGISYIYGTTKTIIYEVTIWIN